MENKHTKGDWYYFEGASPNDHIIKSNKGGCESHTIAYMVNRSGINNKEHKANVKLMAASKDLLEAAINAIPHLNAFIDSIDSCANAQSEAVSLLESAIEKATNTK